MPHLLRIELMLEAITEDYWSERSIKGLHRPQPQHVLLPYHRLALVMWLIINNVAMFVLRTLTTGLMQSAKSYVPLNKLAFDYTVCLVVVAFASVNQLAKHCIVIQCLASK